MRGETIRIPAVAVAKVLDPTGAGDAFRAGVLKAFKQNLPWDAACRMGVTVASFSVEHYGTQQHDFDWESFCGRYESAFGRLAP
jgi:adenosine kinase